MSLGPNTAGHDRDLTGAGGVRLLLVLRDKIESDRVNSLVNARNKKEMRSDKRGDRR